MRRILVLTAALLATASLGGPRSARADLLVNGGFEDPVIAPGASVTYAGGSAIGTPGWTVVGVDVLLLQTLYSEPGNGITAFNAQEGLNSADLTGAGNTGPTNGVSQTVDTVIGATYDLTFYVGRADGNEFYATPATVDLSIDGGPRVGFTNSDATPGFVNWQQFATSFVATGTSTTITFLNGTPPRTSEAGLDNVVLTLRPVPEPSAVALLGLGGVGLIAAARGRKRRA